WSCSTIPYRNTLAPCSAQFCPSRPPPGVFTRFPALSAHREVFPQAIASHHVLPIQTTERTSLPCVHTWEHRKESTHRQPFEISRPELSLLVRQWRTLAQPPRRKVRKSWNTAPQPQQIPSLSCAILKCASNPATVDCSSPITCMQSKVYRWQSTQVRPSVSWVSPVAASPPLPMCCRA